MTRVLVILSILACMGCTRHTSEVWRDDENIVNTSEYTASSLGVVFCSHNEIAIWPSSHESNLDASDFPVRNVCIKYKMDQDISQSTEKITEIYLTDEVEYHKYNSTLRFTASTLVFKIGNNLVYAKIIGGGVANPGNKLVLLKSDAIHFTRTMKTLEKEVGARTTAEKVLVTPISATLDLVDSVLVTASAPIWIPLVALMYSGSHR